MRFSQLNGLTVVSTKLIQFTRLRHEGLSHLHLTNDLSETAISKVDLLILALLKLLPLLRGQRCEPEINREEEQKQDGQWPVEIGRDSQHRNHLQQHRQQRVGKALHRLRDVHDGTVQPGNDRAGNLAIEIPLRQRQ